MFADSSAHDAAASARFPGPDYYEILRWLHEELRPASYVEIGVLYGGSLRLAAPPTIALGVDPEPRTDAANVVRATSAEFFSRYDLAALLGMAKFALAFLDGLHLFEGVAEDLWQLERYAAPDSVVAIHDTIPLDEQTAARTRTTEFYSGDVWKMVPYLEGSRADLDVVTVAAAPTGLTLVRGLGARPDPTARIHEFAALSWADYRPPRSIPNTRAALRAWLLRQ